MLSVETVAAFVIAAYTLSLSPGPSNLYIMACTMGSGGKGGLAAASGMAIGSIIYSVLTAVGVAAVIAVSPGLFLTIKLAGAAYLIYLGAITLRDAHGPDFQKSVCRSAGAIWRQSVLVELTNPKTVLFFLAFLPQFTTPGQGDEGLQLFLLGLIYSVVALSSDLLVVGLSAKVKVVLQRSPRLGVWQERAAGLVLLGLGLAILAGELA